MLDEAFGEVGEDLLEDAFLQAFSQSLGILTALVNEAFNEAGLLLLAFDYLDAWREGLGAEDEPEVAERLGWVIQSECFLEVELVEAACHGMRFCGVQTPQLAVGDGGKRHVPRAKQAHHLGAWVLLWGFGITRGVLAVQGATPGVGQAQADGLAVPSGGAVKLVIGLDRVIIGGLHGSCAEPENFECRLKQPLAKFSLDLVPPSRRSLLV